jgi:hypothetical protein
MCKSTVASPQSRMPEGIHPSLEQNLGQLTIQKRIKHTTKKIPATRVGKTIVQAFSGNVQPGYIYSIAIACFGVAS